MKAMDFKEQLKSTYPYRIELHAHTKPVSPCSEIPPADLVQAYIDQGFHGVVITNHFNLEYLLGLPKEEALDYYLSGYEEARKAAEGTGLQVLLGTEVRFNEHPNEFMIYGVDRQILSECYDYLEKGLAAYRNDVKLPDSVLIQAHPFRDRMLRREPELMDGIEVFNMHPGHNSRVAQAARLAASIPGCIKTVGTDFHHPGHQGLCALRVRQMPRDSFDMAAILRSGDYVFELGGDAIVLP
jgi:histidinol phosphatase-like PHP family hydrolase